MATLTPDQRSVFEGKNFVTVATVGKDGQPRATVVWVHTDGDNILVNGAKSRGWLKNIKRNPNVALSIFDSQNPYRRVTVIGKAVEITTNGANDSINMLSHKYNGQPYPDIRADDPRTIVRIQPGKVTTMNVS